MDPPSESTSVVEVFGPEPLTPIKPAEKPQETAPGSYAGASSLLAEIQAEFSDKESPANSADEKEPTTSSTTDAQQPTPGGTTPDPPVDDMILCKEYSQA